MQGGLFLRCCLFVCLFVCLSVCLMPNGLSGGVLLHVYCYCCYYMYGGFCTVVWLVAVGRAKHAEQSFPVILVH
ncbi:hypothetical protein DFP73DRAFT_535605 [Morchella snyderi]|nr:hypothetical protein DFP73DRAFT_535605 [Morchella snyderi]